MPGAEIGKFAQTRLLSSAAAMSGEGSGRIEVVGRCEPPFEAVREAFAANFSQRGELGAACAVYVDGVPVVDLWGGRRSIEGAQAWEASTLVGFFSVGKPLATLCALQLVETGDLEIDAPVARWWPEFAAAGKERITLRQLLCHQAGLPAIRERLPEGAMFDWDVMARALAAERPWWEPGTRHVYHTNTYGFLVGELVRRITGESIGQRFRTRIARPLAVDLAFGLPEEDLSRVADLDWPGYGEISEPPIPDRPLSEEERMIWNGWFNPSGLSGMGVCNTRAWRMAEMPSANGHGTARGVARVYAALAQGGHLDGVVVCGADVLSEATTPQSVGPCPALKRDASFGLGFQCSIPGWPFGPNPGSFGHMGTGCSLGFADPLARVGFGYVMNHIVSRKRSPRCDALIDALYTCL